MKLMIHGSATYDRAAEIGPAQWNHHDLLIVKEGNLKLATSGGQIGLCADDAVWIPPRVQFSAKSATRSSTIWVVHFAQSDVDAQTLAAKSRKGVWYFPGGASSELASRLMEKLQELYIGNALWQEPAASYFGALLWELSENGKKSLTPMEYSLDELAQWTRLNLSKKVSVRDLAERVGLSESHFRTTFQNQTKQSPGEFLLQLRMREARRLLLQSTLSIKEISLAVGYGDIASFHRTFSTFFKLSPGAYRSSRRKGIA